MQGWKRALLLVLIVADAGIIFAGQMLLSFEINFKTMLSLHPTSTFRYNLWVGAWELYRANLRILACLLVFWSGERLRNFALPIHILMSEGNQFPEFSSAPLSCSLPHTHSHQTN
jgi:hypothetical protein